MLACVLLHSAPLYTRNNSSLHSFIHPFFEYSTLLLRPKGYDRPVQSDGLAQSLRLFDQRPGGDVTVSPPTGGSMVTPAKKRPSRKRQQGQARGQERRQDSGGPTLQLKRNRRGVWQGGSGGGGGGGGGGGDGAGGAGVWTAPVSVIATLTSLPSRLAYTKDTINSLRAQTLPPKVIVVAVPREHYGRGGRSTRARMTKGGKEGKEGGGERYEVPAFLLSTPGVCVLRTDDDYGPATKLVGLARELHGHLQQQRQQQQQPPQQQQQPQPQPQRQDGARQAPDGRSVVTSSDSTTASLSLSRARLVVVDDDTWYPPRTVEALVRWSLRLPRFVVAQHGWVPSHKLVYVRVRTLFVVDGSDEGSITKQRRWPFFFPLSVEQLLVVFTFFLFQAFIHSFTHSHNFLSSLSIGWQVQRPGRGGRAAALLGAAPRRAAARGRSHRQHRVRRAALAARRGLLEGPRE